MYNRIIRPIFIGILLGLALFWLPFFILSTLLFFFIAGLIFRFFIFRRWKRSLEFGPMYSARFADKIRNMSDADYARYKSRYGQPYTADYGRRPDGPIIDIEIK